MKIRFHLESGPLEATVPPTYIASEGRERCLEILRSVLEPAGHVVARATAPVKLLAAHTGLAQYGRNNLAYVRGMGTFARLDTFCTDADLGAEEYESKGSLRLSCCPPCRNCHHVCPTGCIPYDGTVIDASRCLTYYNEHEGDWPEDLDPGVHNSLVGCMRCQALCPANRYYLRKEKVVAEFDREETDIILQDLAPDELPPPLRAKLAALDLDEYSTVLGRNLRALRDAAPAGLIPSVLSRGLDHLEEVHRRRMRRHVAPGHENEATRVVLGLLDALARLREHLLGAALLDERRVDVARHDLLGKHLHEPWSGRSRGRRSAPSAWSWAPAART